MSLQDSQRSSFYDEQDSTVFHLAIPVTDLVEAKEFYVSTLKCEIGRQSDTWVDLNFFGHQLVIHYSRNNAKQKTSFNEVDGHQVPASHFGVILSWEIFSSLESHLRSMNINFYLDPYLRFEGQPGEQKTMFIKDPCDNFIEFKSFRHLDEIFKAY